MLKACLARTRKALSCPFWCCVPYHAVDYTGWDFTFREDNIKRGLKDMKERIVILYHWQDSFYIVQECFKILFSNFMVVYIILFLFCSMFKETNLLSAFLWLL
ncbi:hypothetical protein E2542_SST06294 [Spatholobus suberectus]|nr:hypothetical protein E2542_SST06294 [Spatholobus suberectus]